MILKVIYNLKSQQIFLHIPTCNSIVMFKIICYGNLLLYIINERVNDDNETAANNDALHQLYLIYAVLSDREGGGTLVSKLFWYPKFYKQYFLKNCGFFYYIFIGWFKIATNNFNLQEG